MKNFVWLGCMCLIGSSLSLDVAAQDDNNPRETFVCNYVDGGRLKSPQEICNYLSFTSNRHAERVVERILQPVGLTRNFVVVECPESDNCFATVVDGKRFIIYDGKFMKQIESITNTDWSAISIVAHEIGHHLQGHTIDGMGSRPSKELEADRFSGFVLHQLGASLDESLIAIRTLSGHENTDTHPGRQVRVDAIRQGWGEAEKMYPRWNKSNGGVASTPAPSRPAPVYQPSSRPAREKEEVIETDITVRAPAARVKGCASGDCTDGMGIMVRENQERYEGEFMNGKKHGVGIQYYPDGMVRYKGEFVSDARSGRGTYYFSNGDKYIGYFQNNVPHGKGSYYYTDGERFSGTFKSGVRDGYGVLYRANGTRQAGYYQDDKRVR
ncbi:hypothetical protein [Telluribacter humicola]|uniref:hypothetical protein n=1 Tax=Telluribacter humicola TaxID=1720261 RepID=UPI001E2C653A|nr:hypothetical protein [Telluribacter humicola]